MPTYIENAAQLTLPLIVLRNTVAFPSLTLNTAISDEASVEAANAAERGNAFVLLVYAAGAEGLKVYMDRIVSQLRDTMTMCGTPTLSDIGRDNVFIAK